MALQSRTPRRLRGVHADHRTKSGRGRTPGRPEPWASYLLRPKWRQIRGWTVHSTNDTLGTFLRFLTPSHSRRQSSNENISPSVLNRLIKEVKEYSKNPVADIVLHVNEENVTDIRAEISGPAQTPFEGGWFKLKLVFGPDFPQAPPKGFITTPIFHPNIAKNGEICVNTLKKDWKSDCKLSHILMVIRCLLIEPNPESALNEEAGRMFMEDYEEYHKRARLMCSIHGVKDTSSLGCYVAVGVPEGACGGGAVDGDASKAAKMTPASTAAAAKLKQDKKRSLKRL